MIEQIINIDKSILLYLNEMHAPFFDVIMWWISQSITWVPLYAFLLFLIIKNFGYQKGMIAILFLILTVVVSDKISVKLFKEVFERLRPSHDEGLKGLVHILNDYRGGLYGFVSSHAANSFGIAVFSILLFKHIYPSLIYIMLIWAFLVSYSRIYLGVHYPLDIFCGGILGSMVALFLYQFYIVVVKKTEK